MKIVVVSPFWNAEKFVANSINSLKNQYYTNFVAYYIDDMSTDNSFEVAKKSIGDDERFILIKNEEKKYKTKNFVDVIRNNENLDWDDVIIELDGDDSLINPFVLGLINKIYSDENIWICGSRWVDKNGNSMKYGMANADNPRRSSWNFSHMRTFRAFLFRLINDEDLKYDGEYFKAACDLGHGMPMLEMAGNEHYFYLDQVTYLYNWHDKQSYSNKNSFGDKTLQGKIAKHIYNSKPYSKLQLNNSTPNLSSENKIPESPINNVISNVLQTKTSEKIQQRIENEKNYQILKKSNTSQLKTKQTIQFGRFNVPHSKIIKKK
jgi:glycosyltransferase involved in cell wall biosynthesis